MKIGIFDHVSHRVGGGQLVVARMAALLSQRYDVEVIHSGKGYSLSTLAAAFDVDLNRTKERVVEDSLKGFGIPGSRNAWSYLRNGLKKDRELTGAYDLFIYSGHGVPPFLYGGQGLIYCHFPFEARPRVAMRRNERWRTRNSLDRWIRLGLYERVWDSRMGRYGTVLANSQFTANWIERYWERQAEVIYPPVAVGVPGAEKRNLIVSVGRFVKTDRKKHTQQLQAFPEFLSRICGEWSLCVIGFAALPEDHAYVEKMREAANGLPVTFVVNADRKKVFRLIAEAKLFWHTAGLSDEGSTAPAYMEHFGMATVEAMMSGCVPVVPAWGGQPEIVEHQVNGFLCHDLDSFIGYSARLANDDQLRVRMSQRAMERSIRFRPVVFEQRFSQRVDECLQRLGR